MQNYARQHNLTQFISMQNLHNAVYREEEREMVPLLQDSGVGMIPWSPLSRGFLTRKLDEDTKRKATDPWVSYVSTGGKPEEWSTKINETVAEIAEKRGASMAQVALAWSLSKPYITAPIAGPTSVEKLKDLARKPVSILRTRKLLTTDYGLAEGVHLKLTEEEIKAIDEPYKPRAVVGHW
ncbi:hypothetical protein FRB99_004626 [Tulasnella sp. 403]|nr:hypothetical protein FRB99_004626 [Tulasnella sp. 403]